MATHALAKLESHLIDDLHKAFDFLAKLPAAVTFFGGARIKKDDPYYEISKEIGRCLSATGIPPRTGGGPGIMQSVPEGFQEGLDKNPLGKKKLPDDAPGLIAGYSQDAASTSDWRRQGVNIKLPHEQGLNKAIDISTEMELFPYRKLALYENSRGLVTFPGGYGTLDELFEVWVLAEQGVHKSPLALVGKEFWQPMLDAIAERSVGHRQLIAQDVWDKMKVTDDPVDLVVYMATSKDPGFNESATDMADRMLAELKTGLGAIAKEETAVTIVAGALSEDDPAFAIIRDTAALLQGNGNAMRTTAKGTVASAVCAGARSADANASVQGIRCEASIDNTQNAPEGFREVQEVSDLVTQKLLMMQNSNGLIAGPGDLETLGLVFTTLCEVQTGKIAPRPIVLIGKDYWEPIFAALGQSMLSDARQTIAPQDLKLVTITDDPATAAAAFELP